MTERPRDYRTAEEELAAVRQIVLALKPMLPEQRTRILKAVYMLLGADEDATAKKR